jgi:hypothetical protein
MTEYLCFNKLCKLALEDPEALEKFRLQQVELIINRAPIKHQPRLRGLQFQIDAQRALHINSPMGACLKISRMMHDSFDELYSWLNKITSSNNIYPIDLNDQQHHLQSGAKIIRFTRTSR